jgi:hypothetical protein
MVIVVIGRVVINIAVVGGIQIIVVVMHITETPSPGTIVVHAVPVIIL